MNISALLEKSYKLRQEQKKVCVCVVLTEGLVNSFKKWTQKLNRVFRYRSVRQVFSKWKCWKS